ncbi:hypothetical protein BDZ94DRAFT_1347459 [Collybia nuda]|uniref:Uncharacterized protein n=1 Tax=Collybia nuda TaxID=64659 RepID=A0A9P5XT40_9AGAR|nr:hypothetical protein BDZ94DRAFT_1347459 [Collybia nuda]
MDCITLCWSGAVRKGLVWVMEATGRGRGSVHVGVGVGMSMVVWSGYGCGVVMGVEWLWVWSGYGCGVVMGVEWFRGGRGCVRVGLGMWVWAPRGCVHRGVPWADNGRVGW